MEFQEYRFAVEREALLRPFHFKGGFFTEKWINVLSLVAGGGRHTAIGGSAVLWSDPRVFFDFSETGGNVIMAAMAERGARLLRGRSFRDPLEALQAVLPEVHALGQELTGRRELRPTFTLNSLVCLDLALWKLYAALRGARRFEEMVPAELAAGLESPQRLLAHVPLVTYNTPVSEVVELARGGHFFLKIKIGHPGTPREMLQRDLERLSSLHRRLREVRTPHTPDGRLRYYLDANGRYPDRATLERLLEAVARQGMLEQVALLEEPFAEDSRIEVGDLPVRVAADESLHGPAEVADRFELGYGAVALKPAGKTLSMSLLMAAEASRRGVPCFVADSACVPLLLEWNRNVASRLPAFPGLSCGLLESNGAQNYRRWSELVADHPCAGAAWMAAQEGLFRLEEPYHAVAGGIFLPAGHYERLVWGEAEDAAGRRPPLRR